MQWGFFRLSEFKSLGYLSKKTHDERPSSPDPVVNLPFFIIIIFFLWSSSFTRFGEDEEENVDHDDNDNGDYMMNYVIYQLKLYVRISASFSYFSLFNSSPPLIDFLNFFYKITSYYAYIFYNNDNKTHTHTLHICILTKEDYLPRPFCIIIGLLLFTLSGFGNR